MKLLFKHHLDVYALFTIHSKELVSRLATVERIEGTACVYRLTLTSSLVKLEGDVSIHAEGVVIINHVQRQVLFALAVVVVALGVRISLDHQLPSVQQGRFALADVR